MKEEKLNFGLWSKKLSNILAENSDTMTSNIKTIKTELFAMKNLNDLHYRIVKATEKTSFPDCIKPPKYTLYLIDASYDIRVGEYITINPKEFLHRKAAENDLFDEPLLQAEEMEVINIQYISQQYTKISSRRNNISKESSSCCVEVIDDKDRIFVLNCRDFAELQTIYDKLVNNDVLFLVAPNSGIGCIDGDIAEIAIKK